MLIDKAVEVAKSLIDIGISNISIRYDAREVSWKVTIGLSIYLFKKDLKAIIAIVDAKKLEVEVKLPESEIDIYTPVGKPSE